MSICRIASLAPFISLWGFMVDANSLRRVDSLDSCCSRRSLLPNVRSANTPPRGHSPKALQIWRWFCNQDSFTVCLKALRHGFQVVLSWAVLVQEALLQRKWPFKCLIKTCEKWRWGNCVDTSSVKKSQMPVPPVACCAFHYLIASCRIGSLQYLLQFTRSLESSRI